MKEHYNIDDVGLYEPKIPEQAVRDTESKMPPDEVVYVRTGKEKFKPARTPDVLSPDFKTEKLFVKNTGNEQTGRGLYASKDFEIGEHVFEFEGTQRCEKIHPIPALDGSSAHSIVIGYDRSYFVYAIPNKFSPLRYVNHSCDPNIARLSDDLFGFVAIRPIRAGEELTADYSLLEANPYWKLGECGCGSENCRHTIRSACSLSAEYLCQNWHRLIPEMQVAAIQYSRDHQVAALRNRMGAEYMRDHNHVFMGTKTFEEILNSTHPTDVKQRNLFGAQELAKTFLDNFASNKKPKN